MGARRHGQGGHFPPGKSVLWFSICSKTLIRWIIYALFSHFFVESLYLHDAELILLELRRLLKMHLFCWGSWHLVTVAVGAAYKNQSLHFITYYRVHIEIWVWFFRLFQDKVTSFPDFSRHFVHPFVNKNITVLALNTEIFYTMYSSLLNTKWDSNFWTLKFRCFVSWTAKNLNKCIGNQQCNRHLHFVGQHHKIFPDFSIPMVIFIPWKCLN